MRPLIEDGAHHVYTSLRLNSEIQLSPRERKAVVGCVVLVPFVRNTGVSLYSYLLYCTYMENFIRTFSAEYLTAYSYLLYRIWKILFVPFVLDMSLCVRTFSAELCLDVS